MPSVLLTLLVEQYEGHLVRKKTEWWDAGIVICLGQGADWHMAHLMPLPLLLYSKSKLHDITLQLWYVRFQNTRKSYFC